VGLASLLIIGCGATAQSVIVLDEWSVARNTNAPPPQEPEQTPLPEPPPDDEQEQWTGRHGSGSSAEDPVTACGPGDSYSFVAREFRCPGGGNPLGGDPRAGAQSRVGNVGANSTGHIIDLYRVPCPTGPVDIYVDMYGCPEMESILGG
jgi:hypothetical protein